MVTGMDTTQVPILFPIIWMATTLIVGPTGVALFHRASYRREANELLRSDLRLRLPAQHRPTEQASIEVVHSPSVSWVPYRFFEYLPKKLVRFLVYVPSALLVTLVLPQYVFRPFGLKAGGQDLTKDLLTGLPFRPGFSFVLLLLAILGARYLTLGSSGLILYSFVRGFFTAQAINIPLIGTSFWIYQLWTGRVGIVDFLSWLFVLPFLACASYYLVYRGLGLLAWAVVMVPRLVSELPVSTGYLVAALFCFCGGIIHGPEGPVGPGWVANIRAYGQSFAGLLVPCALFVVITVPLLWALSQIPPLFSRKAPSRLLYLRSFSSGSRSARLLRRLVSVWTECGPIYTLSGPDVFLKTMDSKTFIAYLRDNLRSVFISGPEEAHSRIGRIEDEPTIDGRYRVEEFRCRGRVWQTVFEGLLERCDVALLDLRGFEQSHEGTAFELFTAVQGGHEGKILFLADETTDTNYLREVVAVATEARVAPTARNGTTKIGITEVTGLGRQLAHSVLSLLAERAGV